MNKDDHIPEGLTTLVDMAEYLRKSVNRKPNASKDDQKEAIEYLARVSIDKIIRCG
jgi:hypothetical protein